MLVRIVVFILILCGEMLLLLPKINNFDFTEFLKSTSKLRAKRNETLKEIVEKLDGKKKENYIQRSKNTALDIFNKVGQKGKYHKTLKLSAMLSVSGAVFGLLIRNIPLAIVLAVGLYFLPLWCTKFYLFSYKKFIGEELEVALSLITTSYMRKNDIILSVQENLQHMKNPIRSKFTAFVNSAQDVNENILAEIEKLKSNIDNSLFREWCDVLILCQTDSSLKSSLLPIVTKFSDVKVQQMENETNMMLPLREAVTMILITISTIPLLYFINADWFGYLVNTFLGQLTMAITAVVIFLTVNKAISLSEPIEYEL